MRKPTLPAKICSVDSKKKKNIMQPPRFEFKVILEENDTA